MSLPARQGQGFAPGQSEPAPGQRAEQGSRHVDTLSRSQGKKEKKDFSNESTAVL